MKKMKNKGSAQQHQQQVLQQQRKTRSSCCLFLTETQKQAPCSYTSAAQTTQLLLQMNILQLQSCCRMGFMGMQQQHIQQTQQQQQQQQQDCPGASTKVCCFRGHYSSS